MGEPVPGAIDWLNRVVKTCSVVIHTVRGAEPHGRDLVWRWLEQHGYQGPPLLITNQKPNAAVFLDDRAVPFDGPGTFPTVRMLERFAPWHKRAS